MFLFLAFKLSERSYITSQQTFNRRILDSVKKFLAIILGLGFLAALFFVGVAFVGIFLVALPIIYIYNKYRVGAKPTQPAQPEMQPEIKTIEAEFEVIEEVKK